MADSTAGTLSPADMYWKPASMTKKAVAISETAAPAVSGARSRQHQTRVAQQLDKCLGPNGEPMQVGAAAQAGQEFGQGVLQQTRAGARAAGQRAVAGRDDA